MPRASAQLPEVLAGETEERDLILHDLVVALGEYGLSPTRNDASPALSACDAVAAAMTRRRAEPASFKDIKKKYHRIKNGYEAGRNPGFGVAFSNWPIKDMREN